VATVFIFRILLKILVYAYLDNVYLSRRIEACLKENIHYMWVSGIAQQDMFRKDPSRQENLYYNATQDCFYCPMGQKMVN